MFDLVADVERYPQFLPLCEGLVVREREPGGIAGVLIADMTVGYKAIRETFRTRVQLQPDAGRILANYIDGPFRHLENRWLFRPAPDGCDIDFNIDYEFKSLMLGMLVGALFDKAFRKYSEAFEARARQVYGAGGDAIVGSVPLAGTR
jgi:coenzyme Q-binding protein COQ10